MTGEPPKRSAATPILILAVAIIGAVQLVRFFRAKIAEEQREHTQAVLLQRKSDVEAQQRRDQVAKELMEDYEASKRAKGR
jgi:hypothetical protein